MKKLIVMISILLSVLVGSSVAKAEDNQGPQLIKEAITLTGDTVWEGDYYVTENVDLMGYTLTVAGNLILGDGALNLHGGKLIVQGDFRIQAIKRDSKGIAYPLMTDKDFQFCKGVLKMDQEADYLLVNGNFYPNGSSNTLRNGTVELKGNFMYTDGAYMGAYDAVGNHKTIFSGTGNQRVFFTRSGSQFNILEIHKKSGEMVFESSVDIASIDEDTTIPIGGNGYMYLYLYTNKNFSLQGHTLTLEGTLFFERGSLSLDSGTLIVTEDLRIEKIKNLSKVIDLKLEQLAEEDFGKNSTDTQLVMENDKDRILVEGNFILYNYRAFSKLRAGIMEIKGDVTQIGSTAMLAAYDTHKVVLSGEKKQTVNFKKPSYKDNKTNKVTAYSNFNILEIKNKYVVFETEYKPATYRSIYWQKELIPFALHVNYNEKGVKFEDHSPIIIKGVIYFEVTEINKLLDIKLTYSPKAATASGKYGNKNMSIEGITKNKVYYIPIEKLLNTIGVEYQYDAGTQTLFIVK